VRLVPWTIVMLCAIAACGSKKRQRRTNDAALVEPIKAPVFSDGGTVKAGPDEIEPNDTDDTAMELVLGHAVHGRVDTETDTDSFRIDVPADGVLAIELSAVKDTDLVLELHDSGGVAIAKSDRGAADTREGIPNFGVTKGRYVAVIKSKKVLVRGKPIKPPSPALPYDISAQLIKPLANAEKEPNDDRGTANDLIPGDPVTGYVGWNGDADVWKLSVETLSAKNIIDVEIGPVENTSLVLELADAAGQPLLTRKAPRGAGLFVRGLFPNIPAGAPPYQYLTIKANPPNPESAYQLRVVPNSPDVDAEIEPNDLVDKPMPIPSERTVVTGWWSPGDIDCFAVAPEANPRGLEIRVTVPQTADLAVELFVDGKQIAKTDAKGKGVEEVVKGPVPANAHAVIRVHGADNGTENKYEVKVVEGPFK
jgi:hypothetical protein